MNTADTGGRRTPKWHKHRWPSAGTEPCDCPDPHTDGLGPQRDAILHIAHTADHLTPDQKEQLTSAVDAAFWGENNVNVAQWSFAYLSAVSAVSAVNLNRVAPTKPCRSAQVVKALFDQRRHGYPRPAGHSPAMALLARDLIGEPFTQEHYDLLTEPWRTVIGPVHPDDAPAHRGSTGSRP